MDPWMYGCMDVWIYVFICQCTHCQLQAIADKVAHDLEIISMDLCMCGSIDLWIYVFSCQYTHCQLQPITDKVAHNLEIISKNFQFSTRPTRILMGFVISTISLPGINRKSCVQNLRTLTKF